MPDVDAPMVEVVFATKSTAVNPDDALVKYTSFCPFKLMEIIGNKREVLEEKVVLLV